MSNVASLELEPQPPAMPNSSVTEVVAIETAAIGESRRSNFQLRQYRREMRGILAGPRETTQEKDDIARSLIGLARRVEQTAGLDNPVAITLAEEVFEQLCAQFTNYMTGLQLRYKIPQDEADYFFNHLRRSLVTTYRKFDPELGVKFFTYAVKSLDGAAKNFVRNDAHQRGMLTREERNEYIAIRETLDNAPDLATAARRLDIDEPELRKIVERQTIRGTVSPSLDSGWNENDHFTPAHNLTYEIDTLAEPAIIQVGAMLQEALQNLELSADELILLESHLSIAKGSDGQFYNLPGFGRATHAELAQRLSMNPSQVSRLTRALENKISRALLGSERFPSSLRPAQAAPEEDTTEHSLAQKLHEALGDYQDAELPPEQLIRHRRTEETRRDVATIAVISMLTPFIERIAAENYIPDQGNYENDEHRLIGHAAVGEIITKADLAKDPPQVLKWAKQRIVGNILDALRKNDHVHRRGRTSHQRFEAAVDTLMGVLERQPILNELQAKLEWTDKQMAYYQTVIAPQAGPLDHLDAPLRKDISDDHDEDDPETEADRLQADIASYPNGQFNPKNRDIKELLERINSLPLLVATRKEAKETKGRTMKTAVVLNDSQRHVLARYYGDGVEMKEIASELAVTTSRVSQIRSAAIQALQLHLSLYPSLWEGEKVGLLNAKD